MAMVLKKAIEGARTRTKQQQRQRQRHDDNDLGSRPESRGVTLDAIVEAFVLEDRIPDSSLQFLQVLKDIQNFFHDRGLSRSDGPEA